MFTAAAQGQGIWDTKRLTWGIVLFAASGAIWAAVLILVQFIQARMALAFAATGQIPDAYWRLAACGFGSVWRQRSCG